MGVGVAVGVGVGALDLRTRSMSLSPAFHGCFFTAHVSAPPAVVVA